MENRCATGSTAGQSRGSEDHEEKIGALDGIRGAALFEEMYTWSERVKRLVDGCVDGQLEFAAQFDCHPDETEAILAELRALAPRT